MEGGEKSQSLGDSSRTESQEVASQNNSFGRDSVVPRHFNLSTHWLTLEDPTGLVSFHYSGLFSSDTASEKSSLITQLMLPPPSSIILLDFIPFIELTTI